MSRIERYVTGTGQFNQGKEPLGFMAPIIRQCPEQVFLRTTRSRINVIDATGMPVASRFRLLSPTPANETRECPLLAQSRHRLVHCTCLLLRVKRTCSFALDMSVFDRKQKSSRQP